MTNNPATQGSAPRGHGDQDGAPADREFDANANAAGTELWVERKGPARFVGESSRGASVVIGRDTVPGAFTPGELLKIALASCTAMAADGPLQRRLGEDFASTVRVSGPNEVELERYPRLAEQMELDLSEFAPADRDKVVAVIERAVEKACTVGRTLTAGAEIDLRVADAPRSEDAAEEDHR